MARWKEKIATKAKDEQKRNHKEEIYKRVHPGDKVTLYLKSGKELVGVVIEKSDTRIRIAPKKCFAREIFRTDIEDIRMT